MLDQEEMLRRFYRRIDPAKSVDPDDSELAFQLHLSRLNDPEIVEKLVNRYSGVVYKLIYVHLYYQKMVAPPKEQVLNVMKTIYGYAVKHVDQFHGNESVLNWLFAITYKLSGEKYRRLWIKINPFYRYRGQKGEYTTNPPNITGQHNLDRFSPSHRSIIILRYQSDLSVHDISMILNMQRSKVHSNLKIIRKRQGMVLNNSHLAEKIEAYTDGLLDEDPDEIQIIKTHIADCEECQTYATRLYELEDQLVEEASESWALPELNESDLKDIVHSIKHEIKGPGTWRKIRLPIKQTAWLLGLFILFIGLAFIFIRLTPVEREFPNNRPIETITYPPFAGLQQSPQPPVQSWKTPTAAQVEVGIYEEGQWDISRHIEQI